MTPRAGRAAHRSTLARQAEPRTDVHQGRSTKRKTYRFGYGDTGDKPLRICTLYGLPIHADRLIQASRAEAEAAHEILDGVGSEQV